MAVYVPLTSSLSLRRNLGTDPNGKIKTATVSLSRVSPSIDADDLMDVAEALDACLAGSSIAYERKSTDALEM